MMFRGAGEDLIQNDQHHIPMTNNYHERVSERTGEDGH